MTDIKLFIVIIICKKQYSLDDLGKTDVDVAYDITTGKSRQLIFNSSGHYLQKFQAKYITKVLLEMVNNK